MPNIPRKFIILLLPLAWAAVACGESPTSLASPEVALASTPQAQGRLTREGLALDEMSERELLLAVMGKLNELEARMDSEAQSVYRNIDRLFEGVDGYVALAAGPKGRPVLAGPGQGQGRGEGVGPGQGQGAGPEQGAGQGQGAGPGQGQGVDQGQGVGQGQGQQPWGVPHQLEAMRQAIAALQADVDSILLVLTAEAEGQVCAEYSLGGGLAFAGGLEKEGSVQVAGGPDTRAAEASARARWKVDKETNLEISGEATIYREKCGPDVAAVVPDWLDDPMVLDQVLTIVPNLRDVTDPRSGLVALADVIPAPQVARLSLTDNQALGSFFEFMNEAFDGLCNPPLNFPNKKILNNAISGSCDRITRDDDS